MTLDELGKMYNEQTHVIGFLEADNKRLDAELKEAKRLLKAAVEDFSNMYDHIYYCDGLCDTCPIHGERDHCLKWRYADEALALIGEEGGSDASK